MSWSVVTAEHEDFAWMADIHAASFEHPWSAAELSSFAWATGGFALVVRPHGFVLMRVILDEAEILTIATAPELRRRGVAEALLQAARAEAGRRKASALLLDVARDNTPARAFYEKAGFEERGVRRRYYKSGADALQLALNLASG